MMRLALTLFGVVLAFTACLEETEQTTGDGARETGYLNCSTNSAECGDDALQCVLADGSQACVPAPHCEAEFSCACAADLCGPGQQCEDLPDGITCVAPMAPDGGPGSADGGPDPDRLDGGVPVPDADGVEPDGALGSPDGGMNMPDGGSLEPDAAGADPDGGVGEPDADVDQPDGDAEEADGGVEASDGGVERPDGDTDEADGGVEASDGGVDEADGDLDEADGGVIGSDGGVDESDAG